MTDRHHRGSLSVVDVEFDPEEAARLWLPYALATGTKLAQTRRWIDDQEGQSAALVGLARAVRTFDPDGGASIKTWVGTCVRSAVLDAARAAAPAGYRRRGGRHDPCLKVARSTLYETRSRYGVDVAAGLYDLTPERVENLTSFPGAISIDELSEHGEEPAIYRPPDLDEREERDYLWSLVGRRIGTRLAAILELRYRYCTTMHEIGELFDLSESRVCQLVARAFDRLGVDPAEVGRRPAGRGGPRG